MQKKERGANPFAKKFRGRLVDAPLLRRLFHEGRDRLEIYNGMGLARDVDADLAEALVVVGNEWKVSPDELTGRAVADARTPLRFVVCPR